METNPGPDDARIAEQLKAIARYPGYKKGRAETKQELEATDKHLERIGILKNQVTESNEKIAKIEQTVSFFGKKGRRTRKQKL